ncbi:MAG: sulfatase-like hydrolase/transferase [Chitinophagales bacterium]|nr:sulfatase-like hydrolase/transferase [Chitinophagales bacterium]
MRGKAAVTLLFILSIVFHSCKEEVPSVSTTPNILLIIADDFGFDACPCYSEGLQKPDMPILESLCSNGLIFDNFYANPECSPTRATILAGRYGVRTGVLSAEGSNQIPLSETSIQKLLDEKASGYSHAVIGKWHLSGSSNGGASNPNQMGVGHYAGFLSGAMQDYWNWNLTTDGSIQAISNEYATTYFTDLAIDWINTQSQPWFLWLAYTAPHSPFHLPPDSLHERDNLAGDTASINANPQPYYFAMLEALDHEVGRLLDAMTDEERANTVILFIGDNGTPRETVQAPFAPAKSKGSLYEGGIHVPLIVSGAGVSRIGEREDALINSTDIFATVAEIAGTGITQQHDGYSFKTLLSDDSDGERIVAYSEVASQNITGWAIRDIRYKLIESETGAQHFFDLENDPYEQTDLMNGTLDSAQQSAKTNLEQEASMIRQ